MEEQLVSFETAKLAKEKGFNEACSHYYVHKYGNSGYLARKHGKLKKFTGRLDPEDMKAYSYICRVGKSQPHMIVASTQSLLQKWLRGVHNIDIVINPLLKNKDCDPTGYFYQIFKDLKEVNDWQDLYGKVLDASEQNTPGNHLDQDKYNRLVFEMGFAYHSYEEALEAGLLKALSLIEDKT